MYIAKSHSRFFSFCAYLDIGYCSHQSGMKYLKFKYVAPIGVKHFPPFHYPTLVLQAHKPFS